ncbi:hypothetical protein [Bacillus sp. 1NLA3E]|uniref:hypothetical protein n=1 Tax=Bacillus sp. 1NLA3E TaxID=666686 RepID=UPI000247EDDC|nr:hypothetical protein [Bacillus sp. 1NLA3E]AGK53699.1 hypothetical protein B1NLA3E_09705 [Bacillus sp. 1NLA3E]
MNQSLRALKEKVFLKNNAVQTYFGIVNKQLDIFTMRYRMFGAVWNIQNGFRYINGYWFSDNKNDLINYINCGQWKNLVNQVDQIADVYQVIREEQEKGLWEKRIKLPNNTNYQENWKGKKAGWYIIKSCKHFPCSMTCIQKTNNSLWIEHIGISESENDIKKFINLINLEHNVHLISDEYST